MPEKQHKIMSDLDIERALQIIGERVRWSRT